MPVKHENTPPRPFLWTFDLCGIVYLIENWRTGQCYVGQTVKTFAKRYGGSGLWWEYTTNKLLLTAVKRYGASSFRVRLLARAKTTTELNSLEIRYAREYNSYHPHGYNGIMCGNNRRPRRVANLATIQGPVQLSDPNGNVIEVTDLVAFCEERELDKYDIWKVVTKQATIRNGWTLATTPTKHHPNAKTYVLYDRAGQRYEFTCMYQFCHERGLNRANMQHMICGNVYQSQGYALSPEAFGKEMKRYIVTLEKDGQEVTLTSIKRQCVALGLNSRYIYALKNGHIQEHNGWRLKRVEETRGRLPKNLIDKS